MNSSKVGIFLGCAGVAIAVALGVLFMSGDHEGPVVTFAEDVPTYKQGEEKDNLLKNVEAYDAVDKDVTAMVIVDTVTPLEDNKTARVVYVAKDKSNNITKAAQTVAYKASGKQSADSENTAKAKDSTVVAARSAAAQDAEKKTGSASDTRADSTEKNDSTKSTDSTAQTDRTDSTAQAENTDSTDSTDRTDSTDSTDSTAGTGANGTQTAEAVKAQDSSAEQYFDAGTSTGYAYTLEDSAVTEDGQVFTMDPTEATGSTEPAKPGDPVLTLRTNRVTLQRGQNFSYSEYVKDVTDDKDDYYGLFRRISIKGDYNTQAPGTYTIEYTVTDSEGNTSPAVPLILTVK